MHYTYYFSNRLISSFGMIWNENDIAIISFGGFFLLEPLWYWQLCVHSCDCGVRATFTYNRGWKWGGGTMSMFKFMHRIMLVYNGNDNGMCLYMWMRACMCVLWFLPFHYRASPLWVLLIRSQQQQQQQQHTFLSFIFIY